MRLKKRNNIPLNDETHFYAYGKEQWSVVNLGKMMEGVPGWQKLKEFSFWGWEAFLIKSNGEMNHDVQFRDATWEGLEAQLEDYENRTDFYAN